jgi:hypothetical protein
MPASAETNDPLPVSTEDVGVIVPPQDDVLYKTGCKWGIALPASTTAAAWRYAPLRVVK